ncbi:MAG: hypothetical protein GY710_10115 [Desulfobacteraceae bacterium]|nr:hypothetical protein [Desulfobacteraceae bacterium]
MNYDEYDEKLNMYKIDGPWGHKRSSTFVFKGSNLQFRDLIRSDIHHQGIAYKPGPSAANARKLSEQAYLDIKLKDYNRVGLRGQLHKRGKVTPKPVKRFGTYFIEKGLEHAKQSGDYDYTQGDQHGGVQLNPMEARCHGDFIPVQKFIGKFGKMSECNSIAGVTTGTSYKYGPSGCIKEPFYFREGYKDSRFSKDDHFRVVDSNRQINRELGWNYISVYVVKKLVDVNDKDREYYNQCVSICFSRYSPSNPYRGRIMWLFTYPIADYFLTSATKKINGFEGAIKHNFPALGNFVRYASTRVRDNFNVETSPSRYANFSRSRKKSMWSALCHAQENGFCTINDTKKLYACLDDPFNLKNMGFVGG